MTTWWVILVLGVLTYLTRLSFIALWGRLRMPEKVQRALYFVPVAVLSAMITPELMTVQQPSSFSLVNPRLLAGVLAVVVAYRTRNVFLTILAGMVMFWLLHWVLSAG